jgi:DNA mismatch repair protein MutS
LLFQVGDFYEILGTDAELVASRTTLRISQRSNTSLTGFPVRSFKEWQKILLDSGFKLAICNQTMKRDESNRLFDREVVQLVTPGTILDPDKPTSNYLMAIIPGPSHTFGIAWIDLSTSQFEVSLVNDSQLEEFMEKLNPSELIIPEHWKPDRDNLPTSDSMKYLTKLLKTWKDCQLTSIPSDWTSSLNTITSSYQDILNASSYSETSLLEQQAVIAILNYISCTQRNLVPLIDIPIRYSHDSHMMIDANTRRSLELVNPLHSNARRLTLLGSIDRTVTAGGKRLLHQRLSSPLTRVDDINKRLNVVEYFYKHYEICDWFRQLLKSSSDLERELQKVAIGNASLMDLVSVLNTLKIAQEISLYLDDEVLTSLKDELNGLQEFPELIHELTNAINKEEMTIATGYSLQMDSIREELLNNTNTVHMMADSIIKNYGINKLNVSSHKQYGRVFETTRVQSKKLDKHLIKVDQTQSAVRFLTPELQILNTRYQELSNEYEQMERTICSKLLDKIMDNMKELKLLAKSLANLDVAMTLANVARLKGYSRPVIVCDPIYNVIGGYHPVLADTTQVVPNDCHMSPDSSNVHIITGPNMGGKSTFLRQMALLSILGQVCLLL